MLKRLLYLHQGHALPLPVHAQLDQFLASLNLVSLIGAKMHLDVEELLEQANVTNYALLLLVVVLTDDHGFANGEKDKCAPQILPVEYPLPLQHRFEQGRLVL